MLFSNKKLIKTGINTFIPTIPTTTKSSNFLMIKKIYKIQKKTTRKNILISKIKTPYFLFHFKQWLFYTKSLLQQTTTKPLLVHHSQLMLSRQIKNQFLLKPKNTKTGFISNFNVQKKEQFRTALNKTTNLNFVSINELKHTKPNAFLFIQALPNEPAIKETQQKQFPISSIENITNKTISEYPLFLNSFKNKDILNELILQQKIIKLQKQNWVKNIRHLFLQQCLFRKKLKKQKKIQKFEQTGLQQNTKKIEKWINKLWDIKKLKIAGYKHAKKKHWYKFTKMHKISTRFRKIPLRRLLKIFQSNSTIMTTQLNTHFYHNKLMAHINFRRYYWIKRKKQQKIKKSKFNYFFQRLNNLKYLQKAFLWNIIFELTAPGKQNSRTEFSQWLLKPLFKKIIPNSNTEKFNLSSFYKKIIKLQQNANQKIKKRKRLFKQMPDFAILWQANEFWLQQNEKKTQYAAKLYQQLNGKFPTWWEFPITNYKKLYFRNSRS
jgi:hypothetical protein